MHFWNAQRHKTKPLTSWFRSQSPKGCSVPNCSVPNCPSPTAFSVWGHEPYLTHFSPFGCNLRRAISNLGEGAREYSSCTTTLATSNSCSVPSGSWLCRSPIRTVKMEGSLQRVVDLKLSDLWTVNFLFSLKVTEMQELFWPLLPHKRASHLSGTQWAAVTTQHSSIRVPPQLWWISIPDIINGILKRIEAWKVVCLLYHCTFSLFVDITESCRIHERYDNYF